MFDCLEHALSRWDQLRPKKGEIPSPITIQAISNWLRRDVCGIVQDLIARPDFRSAARWSLDHLLAGHHSEVRHQVEQIDQALRETARDLAKALQASDLRRAIIDLEATQPRVSLCSNASVHQVGSPAVPDFEVTRPTHEAATTAIPGRASKTIAPKNQPAAIYEGMVSALNYIASRPWRDLISEFDYFCPTADLNLIDRAAWFGPNSQSVCVADFHPTLRPDLLLPGDFIVRCLEIRIDYWRSLLQRMFVRTQTALLRQNSRSANQDTLREAMRDIETPFRQLQSLRRQAGESRQREAAMALVQILYAYWPQTDAAWLGKAGRMASTADVFRYYLERQHEIAIADSAALSLQQLQETYRSAVDVELLIEEKASRHQLCLIERIGRREAYWEGTLIELDWEKHDRAWRLFSSMVEKARFSQAVGPDDLPRMSLKDARHDLKKLLPSELFEKTRVQRGEHSLSLPKEAFYFGRIDSAECLVEVN